MARISNASSSSSCLPIPKDMGGISIPRTRHVPVYNIESGEESAYCYVGVTARGESELSVRIFEELINTS